ncbi:uncharacterized protein PGTG_14285 [Puccinia graminis f. sp. tritici CRL 75-36-700-3]|uniref:Uncharacterized protein n=1 Tax=Puccinia graminis f. sp. tritici (strain CRL 75-36-700-3 / race SCCL) TaxID=418459 RepID=E3KVA6_PUCGT|nr:uncharacterized protein PGTG_14285 [Puccinia graminis f. sp. tritici CRL 75-36-700-3]EFP88201.2 hypothetical protein PGTG_14285 [Puccinia graminis f. sp. tritici CRL 75-36-700-3]
MKGTRKRVPNHADEEENLPKRISSLDTKYLDPWPTRDPEWQDSGGHPGVFVNPRRVRMANQDTSASLLHNPNPSHREHSNLEGLEHSDQLGHPGNKATLDLLSRFDSHAVQPFEKEKSESSTGSHGKEILNYHPRIIPVVTSNRPPWSDLPEIALVRKYYSCQTLDWNLSEVNEEAALGAYAMVTEFQDKIPAGTTYTHLGRMQNSHMIFIPFIYKLMIKPLETHQWPTILRVWRSMWYFSEKIPRNSALSADQVLWKFLWISDLILESTIPQLFENSKVTIATSGKELLNSGISTAEAEVVRILSGSRGDWRFNRSENDSLKTLSIFLQQACSNTEKNLEGSLNNLVLERLESTARLITSAISTTLDKAKGMDPQYQQFFLEYFRDVYLRRKPYDPQWFGNIISHPFQKRIDEILCKRGFDENLMLIQSNHPASNALPAINFLKKFDQYVLRNPGAFRIREQVEAPFLPSKISQFFANQFKKYRQSDQPQIVNENY